MSHRDAYEFEDFLFFPGAELEFNLLVNENLDDVEEASINSEFNLLVPGNSNTNSYDRNEINDDTSIHKNRGGNNFSVSRVKEEDLQVNENLDNVKGTSIKSEFNLLVSGNSNANSH